MVLWGWQQLPPISWLSRKSKGSCAGLRPTSDPEPCHEQSMEAFKADALISNQNLNGMAIINPLTLSHAIVNKLRTSLGIAFGVAGSEGSDGNVSVRRAAPSRTFCGYWKCFFEIKLVGMT